MALVTGIVTAIYLFLTYMAHPLPKLFGIDQSVLAAKGGIRMTWRPPAGVDMQHLEWVLRNRARNTADELGGAGGDAYRDGDAFVISVAGIESELIDNVAQRITSKDGVTFHQVESVPEMADVPGAQQEVWQVDDGVRHVDYYVSGPDPRELEARLASVKLPPGLHFAFGASERLWRSYVVRDDGELDGWSVASAKGTYDPNTLVPLVVIDFDREGARRFGELTSSMVGKKLAIMIRNRVMSAPVINTPIRGGRASIAMGNGDELTQERERDELVSLLEHGSLPPGGQIVDVKHVEPKHEASKVWIARFVIAIVGGLVLGWLVFFVLRWTKPVARRRKAWTGPVPWSRIVVTLAAPVALVLVSKVRIYGVEPVGTGNLGLGSLGIAPFISASVLVEIIAVLIPGWRARRHAGAAARMPITFTAAVVTIVFICIQGWFMAQYFDFARMINPGFTARLLVVGSLAGGTAILLAAAALVRWQGLGNGYGALYACGFAMTVREQWHGPVLSGEHVVGGFAAIAIALAFGVALRWRVGGRRIPTSGIAPLADAVAVVAVVALVAQLPVHRLSQKAAEWSAYLHGHLLLFVVVIAAMTAVWSFAFARPLDDGWRRATLLSAVLLVLIGATGIDALMIGITVAYLMDAYADLRARRQKLVIAWTLHDPHAVDMADAKLTAAGIPVHMASSHLRTLLSFFGPFVPIDVLVPAEHAESARQLLSPTASPASSSAAA